MRAKVLSILRYPLDVLRGYVHGADAYAGALATANRYHGDPRQEELLDAAADAVAEVRAEPGALGLGARLAVTEGEARELCERANRARGPVRAKQVWS